MKAEIVMAMQTHRAKDYTTIGRATKISFDPATAAAMCHGLGRRYYLAARLYYCLDLTGHDELIGLLWNVASDAASNEKWKIPKGRDYLTAMCYLAIVEVYGWNGVKRDSQKAKLVGMDKSEWSRVWKDRYEIIYQRLMAWVDVANRHIRKNQYGADC